MLPTDDITWPPKERETPLAEAKEAANAWRGHYYADPPTRDRKLPLASDLAQTSADLLFGEGVEIRAEDDVLQAEVDETLTRAGTHNRLLEAAEIAAALGGVYLRPVWDEEDVLLTVVHPTRTVPTFRWGRLQEVLIWNEAVEDDGTVWRHFENHTDQRIEHALFRGNDSNTGRRVDLGEHRMTEGMREVIRVPELVVAYVPNLLPNRWHPQSPEGRHDWQSAEHLLEDANGTYSSWMRDIRVAKSRLLVPEEFLDVADGQLYFDHDREAFIPMAMTDEDDRKIVAQQFDIRVDQHERSLMSILERLVDHAGYSPQSFGISIEGRAESGTALRVREGKTFRTIGKKQRYFAPAILHVVRLMVQGTNNGTSISVEGEPGELDIVFKDIFVDDPLELAQTAVQLKAADAASMETRVRLTQGLEGEALEAELKRIREDREAAISDALMGAEANTGRTFGGQEEDDGETD